MLRRSFLASASALFAQTSPDELRLAFRHLTQSHGVAHAALEHRVGNAVTSLATPGSGAPTVFLLASITKPMTAVAVMKLQDAGQIALDAPVRRYLPECSPGDRASITVRQLLTHTSGLPDMLPENDELRKRHAPLKEWVALACKTPLLFKPGSECRYQSMGILLAAEIVERVARQPLPRFLQKELFAPLGMKETSLGLQGRAIESTAASQVPGKSDWDWNSPYWRNLGAPWGGAFATAGDVARFLGAFLQPEQQKVLSPKTARAMLTNQNAGLDKPWGIGWAVNTAQAGGSFGKGCSKQAFGHSGSTGTLCWADPASRGIFVLLTTKPAAESNEPVLHPLSDLASV